MDFDREGISYHPCALTYRYMRHVWDNLQADETFIFGTESNMRRFFLNYFHLAAHFRDDTVPSRSVFAFDWAEAAVLDKFWKHNRLMEQEKLLDMEGILDEWYPSNQSNRSPEHRNIYQYRELMYKALWDDPSSSDGLDTEEVLDEDKLW